MNRFCFKNLKAAYKSAAFFLDRGAAFFLNRSPASLNTSAALFLNFSAASLFFLSAADANTMTSIENIKNKTGELLSLKQKDKAIQLVINYSKTERSRAYKVEAGELLFNIGQSFLTKEAQEEYETSLNDTLENPKKSLKSVEACLKLDPINLDCLIQKARLNFRERNKKNFAATIEEIKALVYGSAYEYLFQLFLERENPEFKNKQVINQLPPQPVDRTLFYIVFELERSFEAKNYSRAREVIAYCEKFYNSWPDLAFFKNRLNSESSEKQMKVDDDLLNIYINKCKSISNSAARKFRYDFDLCNRGKKK